MSSDKQQSDERIYLFDKPENIKRVLYGLYAICAVLVLMDFIIHRHVIHDFESLPAFYALYGFAAYVVLVLIAKVFRWLLVRPEDYYSAHEIPKESAEPSEDAEK